MGTTNGVHRHVIGCTATHHSTKTTENVHGKAVSFMANKCFVIVLAGGMKELMVLTIVSPPPTCPVEPPGPKNVGDEIFDHDHGMEGVHAGAHS